ncbi:hypothetical protein SDC9_55038 [bioreactor metagenome]|uniref:Uncharacterized protein n=1 Tax=bioreactor metagenome TaxID=1076179 RepID=A0A644X3L5_9ZZZZ
MKPDNKDIICFNSLLHALNIDHMKRDLITQYTGGRTKHTKDMKYSELRTLVEDLKKQQTEQTASGASAQQIRKKIMHYCHLMLWYKAGTVELDYARINKFCCVSGHKHKELNKYTTQELPTLLWQFEQVYISYKNKKS